MPRCAVMPGIFLSAGLSVKREVYAASECYLRETPPQFREGSGPLPTYQRRGSLQLWQFLVALLDDPTNTTFIAWTGRGLEFKLIEPEEVTGDLLSPTIVTATYFSVLTTKCHFHMQTCCKQHLYIKTTCL